MSPTTLKPTSPGALRLASLALGAILAAAGSVAAADLDEAYLAPQPLPPRVRYEAPIVAPAPRVRYEAPVALPPPPPRVAVRALPVPPPVQVVEGAEICRVFTKPRLDPYGREVLHRVRVCDEGVVERPRRAWAGVPGGYGPVPPRSIPLVPRAIDPDLDGEPG